jgi:hypothetical protein
MSLIWALAVLVCMHVLAPFHGRAPSLCLKHCTVAGEVPAPQVYQELPEEVEDSSITAPDAVWQLAMRPDIEHVVTSGDTAYLVFVVVPSSSGKSKCIAWHYECGGIHVLPEVSDAAAAKWSSAHQRWQLLSSVFGVLLVQESKGLDAALPVAPLLESAISRQVAGVLEELFAEAMERCPWARMV